MNLGARECECFGNNFKCWSVGLVMCIAAAATVVVLQPSPPSTYRNIRPGTGQEEQRREKIDKKDTSSRNNSCEKGGNIGPSAVL